MIFSLSACTVESITIRHSADSRPWADQNSFPSMATTVTRPIRDRFHYYCRILFTQQVKTLISIALWRADLTTALSNAGSVASRSPFRCADFAVH